MGKRLSRIVTRTGDDGTTGLGDGARTRTPKNSPRVEALGAVDELNSFIGLLRAEELPGEVRACLGEIQHDLFDLGGELSLPGKTVMRAAQVERLEKQLECFNVGLPALEEFVLPGGTRQAALCHVARAVCRRAERRLASLMQAETVSAQALPYLNRLSDLLFVLCRALNRCEGEPEALWRGAGPVK